MSSEPSTVSILWEAIRDAPLRVWIETLAVGSGATLALLMVVPPFHDGMVVLYEGGHYTTLLVSLVGVGAIFHLIGKFLDGGGLR